MQTTIQTKIDNLITHANSNLIINNKNEIIALIHYSKALDLFDFITKSYHIQQHEILLKISICSESLDNTKQALEYLNRALAIVPNLPTLILYKSILLLSLHLTDESQRNLLKFKQLNQGHMFYYDTFRLIFYYVLKYEEDILLREINEFIEKYEGASLPNKDNDNIGRCSAFVVVYFIKAQLYINSTGKKRRDDSKDITIKKYEESLLKANSIHSNDAAYLLQEGVTQENLFKIFTMIIPSIVDYHPKMLYEYDTMIKGLKVFFVIFKAIKLFKIKVERKKTKVYYIQQLKLCRKAQSKERNAFNENNSNEGDESDRKKKTVEEVKLDFHNAVRNLYKSVWVYNYAPSIKEINEDETLVSKENYKANYFIRNGYYAAENIKENIIKGIAHNEEYKAKILRHREEMMTMQKCRKNKHNSLSNINCSSNNNNNTNANTKTEPSAQSQVSTISNAKSSSGDGISTTNKKKIHDKNMNNNIRRLKEKIPIHFNVQTEMKTYSNNNNSQSINIIELSDNENAVNKEKSKEKTKKKEGTVKEYSPMDNNHNNNINKHHRKISIEGGSTEELLLSRCKKITNPLSMKADNNQYSVKQAAILALRKNIPQSNKTDLYHVLSKKSITNNINESKQSTSKERIIKLRNNPSAQSYHISLSKDNEQSNTSTTNQLHHTNNITKDKEITFTSIKGTNPKKSLANKLLNHSPGLRNTHHKILPSNSPHGNSTSIPINSLLTKNHPLPTKQPNTKSKCVVTSIRTKNSNSAMRKANVFQMRFNSFHSLKKEDSSLGSGIVTYLENNNMSSNANMRNVKQGNKGIHSTSSSNNNKSIK